MGWVKPIKYPQSCSRRWFRWFLVAFSAPSHHQIQSINQCECSAYRILGNKIKIQPFSFRKINFNSRQKGGHLAVLMCRYVTWVRTCCGFRFCVRHSDMIPDCMGLKMKGLCFCGHCWMRDNCSVFFMYWSWWQQNMSSSIYHIHQNCMDENLISYIRI